MPTHNHLRDLDTFLLSVTDEDGMLLSEFDGFCAGLIVCPEMILPSEWLSEVWGSGGTPDFGSEDAWQNAFDLLMAHYNDVARSLMPPVLEYGPVFDHDKRTDETIWEMWVSGFERAMRLRPDAWVEIVESGDEEVTASINLMLTLFAIVEDDSDLPKETIKELQEKAPDLIADMVMAINRWTKGSRSTGLSRRGSSEFQTAEPYRTAKVGRNDACPCGSGRKYKRCCGAN